MRAARIAAGLPPDSLEPKEAEQPAWGFNMAEAEFVVSQAAEMVEQQAILESIRDEAYVEANRWFLQ